TSLYRIIECAVLQPPFTASAADTAQPAPAETTEPAAAAVQATLEPEAPAPAARKVEITMPPATAARSLPATARADDTGDGYDFPAAAFLQEVPTGQGFYMSQERLEQNADL